MADDFAASTATTGTFVVNGRTTGNLEAVADHDWFKGWLFAGRTYIIEERGTATTDGTLVDPFVSLRDQIGTSLASDDDGGIGLGSYLRFVPESSGFYFVDAGEFGNNAAGTYEIVVAQQADALSPYNLWGSSIAATVLLGDVNAADFDIIDSGNPNVREDIVSIAANGNVFVSRSNSNGSGFADPVLSTTGGTASDRLFNMSLGVEEREDLFQIYNGNAYVATGNNSDGLDDFAFWGSGFLPSATIYEFGFNLADFNADAIQFSGGSAFVALQNATNNGFLAFTQWTTGLTGSEQLLDLNGDFRGDLLQFYNGRAYVATSNGANAFNAFVQVDTGITASDRVGDFNGDFRDDLFQIYNGNMYVSLSNGVTFNGFTQWGTGALISARIGDFNGDNRDDIFQVDANGTASVALANSLGTGFTAFHPWATNVGANDLLGLVNGDTLLDVIQVYNGNAYVWESIVVPPV